MSSAADEACDFARALGFTLDPEQELALQACLAEKPNGKWAAFEAAIIAGRQNLKTFLFEVDAFSDLYLGFGSELLVWTAHEFSTAMEAFRDCKQIIESHDFLSRRVKKVNEANGEEGIEFRFPSGTKRLRFKARTKTGGRGLTGDKTYLDEAFALQPAHMGSLMPTMSAKTLTGNPRIYYGSSAGKLESSVLRTIRDRGRSGGDPTLVYVEWCAPEGGCSLERCDHRVGSVGCALDDIEKVRLANPALDRRIDREWIGTERRTMTPVEFARERLGWWEDPIEAKAGLPLDAWFECRDRRSQVAEVRAFAYAVGGESDPWASIGVCGTRADGLDHVEVVEYRPGTDWLAERVAEIKSDYGKPVFRLAKGPTSVVRDEVEDAGVDGVDVSADEYAQACGLFVDRVVRRACRHLGQAELDMSIKGAARVSYGDSFRWSQRTSRVEISPLVVATLALWGARQLAEEGKPVFAY